jgi:hypothetical protein
MQTMREAQAASQEQEGAKSTITIPRFGEENESVQNRAFTPDVRNEESLFHLPSSLGCMAVCLSAS